MEKTTLLMVLPAIVAAVALAGLVRGVVTKRPPGQRGLVGTGLEDSRTVYVGQLAALAVLVVACLAWMVWVFVGR